MAEHHVRLASAASGEMKRLPADVVGRIQVALRGLRTNPRPSGVRKLRGLSRLYRVRVGAYRIVYEVDDAGSTVLVTKIGHRRDVYA